MPTEQMATETKAQRQGQGAKKTYAQLEAENADLKQDHKYLVGRVQDQNKELKQLKSWPNPTYSKVRPAEKSGFQTTEISLEISDTHLAALELVARLNGRDSAVEELEAESRDFVASALESLSADQIGELLA